MERSVVEVYRDEIGEPARRDDARVEPEDLRARPGAEAEDGRRVVDGGRLATVDAGRLLARVRELTRQWSI